METAIQKSKEQGMLCAHLLSLIDYKTSIYYIPLQPFHI